MGTEIVPAPLARVVPARPRWRQTVEQGTTIAIGLGAEILASEPTRDTPLETIGDAALGAAVEGQRVALDATERLIDTGAAIARAGMRIGPIRSIVRGARRAVEPARVHGHNVRVVAVQETQAALPDYTGRAANAALDLIQLDDVMEHIDLNKLLERVDLNEIMSKLDLDSLVSQTDLGKIIAQSTGGIASGTVDLVRRQGVGIDGFVWRWAVRLRPRRLRDAPPGPPLLVDEPADDS